MDPEGARERRWLRWGLAAILAAYFAVFGRSLTHDYVWDESSEADVRRTLERPLSEALFLVESQRVMATARSLPTLQPRHESFRPVAYLSWVLQVRTLGVAPPASHLVSLLLGALNVLLAFGVARRVLLGAGASLCAAAVFALHPLQTESVVYSGSRGDLLSGTFALGALLWLLPRDAQAPRAPRVALAVLAYVLGLLSKEVVVGLPLVATLLALATGRLRAQRVALAALWLALPAYFALRRALSPDAGVVASEGTLAAAVRDLPALVLQYLNTFAIPFGLSIDRLFMDELAVAAWIVLPLPVLAGAVLLLRPGLSDGARRATLSALAGAAFAVIFLGPAAVAFRSFHGTVADRYAYLAVLGFALAVAAVGAHLGQVRPALAVPLRNLACAWVLVLALLSLRQASVWQNDLTLYQHALEVEPQSSMAHYRMGYQLALRRRWPEAIALFQRALELDPNNERAWNNLGVAYLTLGRLDEAEHALRELVQRKGGLTFRGLYNLGLVLEQKGDRKAACNALLGSLEVNPGYPPARAKQGELGCSAAGSP